MRIAEFLDVNAVEASLGASNKPGVIRELVGLMLKVVPDLDPNELVDTLERREKLQSTGIGHGVAIPHGKASGVQKLVACVGRSSSGVDFQSLDGLPTHLFFTLLVPETEHGTHIKALARLSRLLKDMRIRRRLLEAPDSNTIYDILLEEDDKL
jgi:PTS system nitrogen regulatory IIA component